MAEARVNRQRPDGWWYPWIFVAGFAVVIVVNGFLIFFATSTFNGLETSNPYERGVAYNKEIAAADAQTALGWTAEFALTGVKSIEGQDGRKAALRLRLRDRDAAPVDGLTIVATLRRPTQAGLDQTVELLPGAPGEYGAVATVPLAGLWDIKIVAERGTGTDDVQTFRLNERLDLR